MGNLVASLNGLQRDRNALKIQKKVMSNGDASLNKKDLPQLKKEPDSREVNVSRGRHHEGIISILFILLILVFSIALAIFLKGYSAEMGRVAARMDAIELSVSKNRNQIKAVYKDVQAVKKEINMMNIEITNIGAGNERIKKAGALIKSGIYDLIKSQNALYNKISSLEESLKQSENATR